MPGQKKRGNLKDTNNTIRGPKIGELKSIFFWQRSDFQKLNATNKNT